MSKSALSLRKESWITIKQIFYVDTIGTLQSNSSLICLLKFSVSQGIESIMEWGREHPDIDKKQIIPDILQNVVCLCKVNTQKVQGRS